MSRVPCLSPVPVLVHCARGIEPRARRAQETAGFSRRRPGVVHASRRLPAPPAPVLLHEIECQLTGDTHVKLAELRARSSPAPAVPHGSAVSILSSERSLRPMPCQGRRPVRRGSHTVAGTQHVPARKRVRVIVPPVTTVAALVPVDSPDQVLQLIQHAPASARQRRRVSVGSCST